MSQRSQWMLDIAYVDEFRTVRDESKHSINTIARTMISLQCCLSQITIARYCVIRHRELNNFVIERSLARMMLCCCDVLRGMRIVKFWRYFCWVIPDPIRIRSDDPTIRLMSDQWTDRYGSLGLHLISSDFDPDHRSWQGFFFSSDQSWSDSWLRSWTNSDPTHSIRSHSIRVAQKLDFQNSPRLSRGGPRTEIHFWPPGRPKIEVLTTTTSISKLVSWKSIFKWVVHTAP
jgi:hypothetical protein